MRTGKSEIFRSNQRQKIPEGVCKNQSSHCNVESEGSLEVEFPLLKKSQSFKVFD